MTSPPDDFIADLHFALLWRGRQVRRLDGSELSLQALKQLQAMLWLAAQSPEARPPQSPRTRPISQLRHEADRADAIERIAKKLLRKLPLGTIGQIVVGWRMNSGLRVDLQQLVQEAQAVAKNSRKLSRRAPGPVANTDRRLVARFVALQLIAVGVPPTKARTGPFAKVLRVVLAHAGWPNMEVAGLGRSIGLALDSPEIKAELERMVSNSTPEKIVNL